MDKYNKVVTYEFGTALVPGMLGMMDALGFESRIISYGDKQGLVRFETAYRQGNELDRATAWLDAKTLNTSIQKNSLVNKKSHHMTALFIIIIC